MKRSSASPNPPAQRRIGSVVTKESFGSNADIWDLLVRTGNIPEKPVCRRCRNNLNTNEARKKLHFSIRCTKCMQSTYLLEKHDLFEVKNIRKFLFCLTKWLSNAKFSSIKSSTAITKRTWRNYKRICHNVLDAVLKRMKEGGKMKLGGPGRVVEVDECHLFTRKYGRGKPLANESLWVVGLIERDNLPGRKATFLLTKKRSGKVLVPFINKWVEKGSILISDEWKGYTKELDGSFVRKTVNHSKEYGHREMVDGVEIPVNTNHIEREWRELRKVLEYHKEDQFPGLIQKEIFRIMFLAGRPEEEWPFIFLEQMGKVRNNQVLF